MVRRREQRRKLGIELEWPDRPIGVLRIPTGDERVEVNRTGQGVCTCCTRRVVINVISPYQSIYQLGRELEEVCPAICELPVIGDVVRLRRALEVLNGS